MIFSMLNKEQIEKVYNECMKVDFPPNELKPLAMIYKAMDEGVYFCYGLMEKENILGYAYLMKLRDSEDYLIDYIATDCNRRNQGLGAVILKELQELLKNADSVIGEVENPEMADREEDRVLQQRRYGFYMRNGLMDTGVLATCFGVPFIILEQKCRKTHTKEEIISLYKAHYKALLPKEMYEKNIRI